MDYENNNNQKVTDKELQEVRFYSAALSMKGKGANGFLFPGLWFV